jgi:hypothetical protein
MLEAAYLTAARKQRKVAGKDPAEIHHSKAHSLS